MEHNYGSNTSLQLGATFKSFEELQESLNEYMHRTSTVYTIVHSRRITHHAFPKELKYVHIKYGCKQYGHLRSKSKGIRPNQKSFKTDCQSFIYVTAVRSRGHLLVKKMLLEHNHITGPEVALLYPEKRKVKDLHKQHRLLRIKHLPRGVRSLLDDVQKKKKKSGGPSRSAADNNLESDGDYPEDVEGPSVNNAPRFSSITNLDLWVDKLRVDYGCNVASLKDGDILQGVFWQDPLMKEYFAAFPEFLYIDCCGTLLPGETFVFLFAIEDCIGKAEIVALSILMSIQTNVVDWLLSSFVESNEHSTSTKVVLSNITSNHGEFIKKHFPTSRQLISPYHSMNVWRQMMPRGETGVTETGEDLCLSLFSRALNATSEAEYQEVYAELRSALPDALVSYYRENWHYIRDTWALGITYRPDFMSSACKIVDVFRRKLCIQSLTSRSLSTFFGCLFIELHKRREERKNLSLLLIFKSASRGENHVAARAEYARHVTPYALTYIDKQFDLMHGCKPFEYTPLTKSEQCVSVSVESCECPFFTSMSLPCCHLFVRRNFVDMDLYSASLYSERWTKDYYVRVFARGEVDEEDATDVPLSTIQKLHRASDITNELASLISKAKHETFATRMNLLQQLVSSWKCNEAVALIEKSATESLEVTGLEGTAPEELCDLLGVDSIQYVEVVDDETEFLPQDSPEPDVESIEVSVLPVPELASDTDEDNIINVNYEQM